jgi:hypothetical protein
MVNNGNQKKSRRLIKDRSQFLNNLIGRFTKRDTETGRIIDVKSDDKPFKRVRKEK